jgi:hypothetical protein
MNQDEERYYMDGMRYNCRIGYHRYSQNDLFTLRQSELYRSYPNYYKILPWLEASVVSNMITAEPYYQ